MPHVPDLHSLLKAAEQAAAAGEHAAAERHLREAAALQEAHLGPLHPDLATTLNNLAVACERADNPVDAERYFRKAFSIATAVLEPDHPFVATSRRNLEDFCAARGKPVEPPAPPRPNVTSLTGVAPAGSGAPRQQHRTTVAPVSRGLSRSSRTPLIVAGLAATLLVTLAVATWLRSSPSGAASPAPAPSQARQTATVPPPPLQRAAPEPPRPAVDAAADVGPAEPAAAATAGRTADADTSSLARTAAPHAPAVVTARLCAPLSPRGRDWGCTAATSPLEPGALFFYTRVKSPRTLAVQHRWYRGDRLEKVVTLSVGTNMREGYRTYSRHRVGASDAGEWRVELSTRDGTVLHEERFVVR